MTLREMWEIYLRDVVLASDSSADVTGAKRTFYAGAWTLLYLLENIPEEVLDSRAAAIQDELDQFEGMELARFERIQ